MGNQDNWTTPKQLKIEREGEPRGIRRGNHKKSKRRKGKKARIDEILAAKKAAERYREHIHDDEKNRIEHPERYIPVEIGLKRYNPEYRKWFKKATTRLEEIIARAVKDSIITAEDAEDYIVELYPFKEKITCDWCENAKAKEEFSNHRNRFCSEICHDTYWDYVDYYLW